MRGERSREWIRSLSPAGDQTRIRLTTRHGQVVRYTVQYEALIAGDWLPVTRYDNAHGRPHRDLLGWHGETVHKKWLPDEPLDRALNRAVAEIDASWPRMRAQFRRRRP